MHTQLPLLALVTESVTALVLVFGQPFENRSKPTQNTLLVSNW